MKSIKTVLAFLLALAMILSLAACSKGNSDTDNTTKEETTEKTDAESTEKQKDTASDKEIKNVIMWLPTPYDMPLAPEVNAKINEISEARYGIHYDITFVNFGNYSTQLNLALTSDEVDICEIFGMYDYYKNGQIADLTDYYEASSDEFKAVWNDMFMQNMKINDRIYAIPHISDFGHYLSLNLDQEIADKYGITSEQELTMDEASDLLAKIHEDYPDRYTLGAGGTTTLITGFYTWDSMNDSVGVLPDKGQNTTVESLFDNKDFIDLAKRAEEWYQAGYVMPDILSNTQSWAGMLANHQIAAVFDTYGVNFVDGAVRTRIKEVGHWTEGMIIGSSVWGINANSKDPETAFYALSLFYTDPDMATYLNNGIEGKNYTKNDDGTISYIDGKSAADSGYGAPSLYWIIPGAQFSQALDVNGADFYERLIAFNEEGEFSKINGFQFDPEAVIDEYTACKAVIDKYRGPLLSGAVDVDATLEQARTEMKAAGEDKVIAEKQRQIDEYLSK